MPLISTVREKLAEKLSPQNDEASRVTKYMDEVTAMAKARAKWEAKWYENGAFKDGRHFTMYQKSTGKLVNVQPGKNEVFRVHHKAHRKMKDIQNTILANDPIWSVLPSTDDQGNITKDGDSDALRVGDWLQDFFDRKDMRIKLANLVMLGLEMSYACLWFGYDNVEDDFYADVHDAFDILFSGDIYDIQDAPKVVKQFVRDISAIQADPNYINTEELKPDYRFAASDVKNQRYLEKFAASGKKEAQTTSVCYEVWEKLYVDDKLRTTVKAFDTKQGTFEEKLVKPDPEPMMDEDGNPQVDDQGEPMMQEQSEQPSQHWVDLKTDGSVVMHRITLIKNSDKVHQEDYFDFQYYPCAVWRVEAGLLFQPAWIERIISMNRSYDVIQSRIEQYLNTAVSGRLSVPEAAELKEWENDMGITAMTYSGPQKPEWEIVPALPATVMQHLMNLDRGMDEMTVYGSHMASAIQGGRGAKALEAIRQADSASVKSPVDNLSYTLEQSATILLALADYHLDTVKTVYHSKKLRPDYFRVVGGRYADTQAIRILRRQEDVTRRPVVLDASMKVKVQIETGINMTPQARQDLLIQLATMQKIPDEELFEELKFTNAADMAKRLTQQKTNSMIYTEDFKALSPETKMSVLQELQAKNINITTNTRDIGTAIKSNKNGASES